MTLRAPGGSLAAHRSDRYFRALYQCHGTYRRPFLSQSNVGTVRTIALYSGLALRNPDTRRRSFQLSISSTNSYTQGLSQSTGWQSSNAQRTFSTSARPFFWHTPTARKPEKVHVFTTQSTGRPIPNDGIINKEDALHVPVSQTPAVWLLRSEPRAANETIFSYYFSIGRAFVKFYWTGLKGVSGNMKLARGVRSKSGFQLKDALRRIQSSGGKDIPSDITRSELQLLVRSSHDIRRLPLLLIMFMICGEFLPLVIYAFRRRIVPLLPYTCRTMDQQLELLKANHDRRSTLVQQLGIQSLNDVSGRPEREQLNVEAKLRNLGLPLIPKSLQPQSVLARSKEEADALVYLDNVLIERGGGTKKLGAYELLLASIIRDFTLKVPSNVESLKDTKLLEQWATGLETQIRKDIAAYRQASKN